MNASRRRLLAKAPNVKDILTTFATIYTILGMVFIFGPLAFIRYEIIFQSGLMGYLLVIMTILLSCRIVAKELCVCHGEYYILNRHMTGIIWGCLFAAFFTAFYIWNVSTVLMMCPQFEVNASATLEAQTEVNITVSYVAPSHGIMRRQSLNLKYDTEKRCLLRKQTNNPEAEEHGIFKMESYRYEAARHKYLKKHKQWLDALLKKREQQFAGASKKQHDEWEDEEEEEEMEEMQFYMIQNEIAMLLEEASQPYDKSGGFTTRSIIPLQTTNNEEDEKFQYDRAAKICRNEKGFGWFLLYILIFCELLYFATFVVFYWLWTWMPVLAPIRRSHTTSCTDYLSTLPPQTGLSSRAQHDKKVLVQSTSNSKTSAKRNNNKTLLF